MVKLVKPKRLEDVVRILEGLGIEDPNEEIMMVIGKERLFVHYKRIRGFPIRIWIIREEDTLVAREIESSTYAAVIRTALSRRWPHVCLEIEEEGYLASWHKVGFSKELVKAQKGGERLCSR